MCDGFCSWCRCRLVIIVSPIDSSIRVGIRSSLILFVWHLGHNVFPFHLYVQFDVAHDHAVVTSNVDVVHFGLRYTVWAFPRPIPPSFLWNMAFMILYFFMLPILPRYCLFRFSIRKQICLLRFNGVCSFPYLRIAVSYRVVVGFPKVSPTSL